MIYIGLFGSEYIATVASMCDDWMKKRDHHKIRRLHRVKVQVRTPLLFDGRGVYGCWVASPGLGNVPASRP